MSTREEYSGTATQTAQRGHQTCGQGDRETECYNTIRERNRYSSVNHLPERQTATQEEDVTHASTKIRISSKRLHHRLPKINISKLNRSRDLKEEPTRYTAIYQSQKGKQSG
jgi:hypothetical protein